MGSSVKKKMFCVQCKRFCKCCGFMQCKGFWDVSIWFTVANKELDLGNTFSNFIAITAMKQQHFLEVIEGITKSSKLSKTSFKKSSPAERVPIFVAAIGDWVLVEYDGQFYTGEIREIENNEYLVSIRAGKHWKWPDNVDEINYPQKK